MARGVSSPALRSSLGSSSSSSSARPRAAGLDGLDDAPALDDLAEDDVLVVEEVGPDRADEELGVERVEVEEFEVDVSKRKKRKELCCRSTLSLSLSFSPSFLLTCEPFVLGPALAIDRMPAYEVLWWMMEENKHKPGEQKKKKKRNLDRARVPQGKILVRKLRPVD